MATPVPGLMSDDEAIYQIRSHFLYEVKWMIFAATEFRGGSQQAYVALLDSAVVHARNLLEFGRLPAHRGFTLAAIGGQSGHNKKWERFVNNRVTHMYAREKYRPPWPSGLDNERPDRLVVMAKDVLAFLASAGPSIQSQAVQGAYSEVLSRAAAYLADPTSTNHDELAALYDESRDQRGYSSTGS